MTPRIVEAEGIRRLERACESAIERLADKEAVGIDPDVFAEVGEALFWLEALAEARGRHKGTDVVRGLGWARDRVAHGVPVSAPAEWIYGSEVGRLVLGKGQLGVASGHKWMEVEPLRLSLSGGGQRQDPGGVAAYEKWVAGKRVVPVLSEALDSLR
jgi:hypothetical protein